LSSLIIRLLTRSLIFNVLPVGVIVEFSFEPLVHLPLFQLLSISRFLLRVFIAFLSSAPSLTISIIGMIVLLGLRSWICGPDLGEAEDCEELRLVILAQSVKGLLQELELFSVYLLHSRVLLGIRVIFLGQFDVLCLHICLAHPLLVHSHELEG